MSKNLSGGQEVFDNIPVTIYEGAFRGTFDLDEATGLGMAFDDVVTFFVTARVGNTAFAATKEGDVKRKNSLEVIQATPLDPEIAEKVYDKLGVYDGEPVYNNDPQLFED